MAFSNAIIEHQPTSHFHFRITILALSVAVSNAVTEHQFADNFLFRQLFDKETDAYTYILADTNTKEAVIIDPVSRKTNRDLKYLRELGLNLKYVAYTSTEQCENYRDCFKELKKEMKDCKSIISEKSKGEADIKLVDRSTIQFGQHTLVARSTPGHTEGSMTYIIQKQGMAFTGNTILIRGFGGMNRRGGDAKTLHESVHRFIFTLPPHFKLYPAYDHQGFTVTTVGEEKSHNEISKFSSKDEFAQQVQALEQRQSRTVTSHL